MLAYVCVVGNMLHLGFFFPPFCDTQIYIKKPKIIIPKVSQYFGQKLKQKKNYLKKKKSQVC
jgi:hypothetical protein